MKPFFFILQNGKPVPEPDMDVWHRYFEKEDRLLWRNSFGDVRVSTVFLGMDHCHGSGPPILFETMIFGGPLDQEQWRYCSMAEANEGHCKAIEMVQDSLQSTDQLEM